jgi:hypothetical protein
MDDDRASSAAPKPWIAQRCALVGEHSRCVEGGARALLERREKQM